MAPATLNLKDASFRSLHAFSSAATPLGNSFNLSCRSPIISPSSSRPTWASPMRHGPYLGPPTPYSIPDAATGSRRRESEEDNFMSDGNETEDSPTDRTWFLPHSPGLPPPPSRGRTSSGSDDGKLGVLSAVSIIVGKTMGVSAYTVPSAVFAGVGSVGMSLTLWVLGSLISFCGLAVYLDLGTALPRSGGERVYLERVFRRPRMLATCMFASYAVLLGFSTPNAIVLGEHALYAARGISSGSSNGRGGAEEEEEGETTFHLWAVRLIAVLAVTLLCLAHARRPRLGLRLVNVLGVAKVLILAAVLVAGVAGWAAGVGAERRPTTALSSTPGLTTTTTTTITTTAQRNFRALWAGTSVQPYDHATALLKVLYCFRGYSTANQVLGDVRDPVRTLRIAAPLALALVSVAYLAVSVAFFLVVDVDELRTSGVVAAEVFFRRVFDSGSGGEEGEEGVAARLVLPLCVVVSAAGSIAATSFAQARVNEELAREGILPAFWLSSNGSSSSKGWFCAKASDRTSSSGEKRRTSETRGVGTAAAAASTMPGPAPTPTRGLLLHWLVSVAAIVLPPPGRIFNFLVDAGSYPVSVLSVAVSLGLLYLHSSSSGQTEPSWTSPCRAPRAAVVVFAATNGLLLVLPWIGPRGGRAEDGAFPSWAYPATGLGVLGLGAVYWLFWRKGAAARWAERELEQRLGSARARSEEEDDDDEGGRDAEWEGETVVVLPEEEEEGEEEARCRLLVEVPMVSVVGKASQACGCRACPQVRRRLVCGCANCPKKLQRN